MIHSPPPRQYRKTRYVLSEQKIKFTIGAKLFIAAIIAAWLSCIVILGVLIHG